MARDWNDYEAKIREEIERKVADATQRAERKAERMRARAERTAERARERAEWYGEKLKEKAQREGERAKEGYHRAANGHSPWAGSIRPLGFNFSKFGCESGKGHESEIFFGLLILAVGVGLLLVNLHIFQFRELTRFWPVILIVAGVLRITRARFASAHAFGIFLLILGVIFLLGNLNVVHVSWNLFWPAVMIVVGLQHLLRRFDPPKPDPQPASQAQQPPPASGPAANPFTGAGVPPPPSYGPETPSSGPRPSNASGPRYAGASAPPVDPPPPSPGPSATGEPDVHLHEYCIFTGGKRRIVTNNFRGGEIVAVFGGVEVDLRGAQLGGDEAVVDITTAFGGCNIKVPTNWYVEMRGVAAFGGYSNKTIPPRVSPGQRIQKLIVTGSAAFGGVVIEN